jgi:formylmethanofuran dehydrogenase subunit D
LPLQIHMPESFLLIPGRTSTQGTTLNEGKYTEGYVTETSLLRMAQGDMQRLGLAQGDHVRMWKDVGEVVIPVEAAKGDELLSGLVFISYGDKSSRLMAGDTHGSGMPDSKGLDVWVEKASQGGISRPTRAPLNDALAPRFNSRDVL